MLVVLGALVVVAFPGRVTFLKFVRPSFEASKGERLTFTLVCFVMAKMYNDEIVRLPLVE